MKFQKYLKESQENSIRKKIIEYFTNNKHPDDEQIHKFAEDNKINKHELEDNIYAILSDFLYNGRYNQSKNKESN